MEIFLIKHLFFESKHYVNNFNISKTFNNVFNTLQNFIFIGATAFAIAPLVKDVGTKRLGKGRVK